MENTPTIRTLYPNLTEAELRQAEDNLDQYIEIVLTIYERVVSQPETYAQLRTLLEKHGTVSCTPSNEDRLPDHNPNTTR